VTGKENQFEFTKITILVSVLVMLWGSIGVCEKYSLQFEEAAWKYTI